MVALFFAVSPYDLKEYENWLESEDEEDEDCEDYDEEECEYDRYEKGNRYSSDFIKPIFFDEILKNFVNGLSEKSLRNILAYELKKDEEYTFNKYLKNEFQRYISVKNNIYVILDKLNRNFYKLSHDYDYNNKNYAISLLSEKDKLKVLNAYTANQEIKSKIDKIILNPSLAMYDDYKWFITLYRDNNSKKNIGKYFEKLTSFFDTLKYFSIKNTIPKSNVLIAIHVLNNYNLEECAKLLVINCKYEKYVDYILECNDDCYKLYKLFNKNVENEKYVNQEHISKIYYRFYLRLSREDVYNQYLYYSFLYSKNVKYLLSLKNSSNYDYYINKLINNTENIIALEKIYLFLNKKDELLKLLLKKENEYRLIYNINYLKNDYNEEILKYLKMRFYEVVEEGKTRENYKKASNYIKEMSMLYNGKELVNSFIDELKESKYSKRTALFDEISKVI